MPARTEHERLARREAVLHERRLTVSARRRAADRIATARAVDLRRATTRV